jgi:hypothetical protein
MNFTREDWRLFLKRETLCQKAGVREGDLLRLVVKELTDNAVDVTEAAGSCAKYRNIEHGGVAS